MRNLLAQLCALAPILVLVGCEPASDQAAPRPSPTPSDPGLIAFVTAEAREIGQWIAAVPVDGGDATRLLEGTDPAWSPDGDRLVFTCGAAICVMDADGTNAEQITTPPHGERDETPSWGPNGSIAFARNYRDGSRPRDVFVVPEDGGDPQLLTEERSDDFGPSWSPDGTRIAFIRVPVGIVEAAPYDDPPRINQIWTMAVDGSDLRRLTTVRYGAWRPKWSPDGTSIVFDSLSAVWVVPAAGGEPRKLEPATTGDHPDTGAFPTWSPDSKRIAYTCEARGFGHHDLCVMNLDGTGRTTILDTPANEALPAWQPSSRS